MSDTEKRNLKTFSKVDFLFRIHSLLTLYLQIFCDNSVWLINRMSFFEGIIGELEEENPQLIIIIFWFVSGNCDSYK